MSHEDAVKVRIKAEGISLLWRPEERRLDMGYAKDSEGLFAAAGGRMVRPLFTVRGKTMVGDNYSHRYYAPIVDSAEEPLPVQADVTQGGALRVTAGDLLLRFYAAGAWRTVTSFEGSF